MGGEAKVILEAERRLAGELRSYDGQWVAIRDRRVVAHAPSIGELRSTIERDGRAVDAYMEVEL